MTEKIKKLIESVETYEYPTPWCYNSKPMTLVKKSDLIRIVEELQTGMVSKEEMFEFMQYVLIRKQGEELNPTYQKKLYEQFKNR